MDTLLQDSQNSDFSAKLTQDLAQKICYKTAREGSKFPGLYLCIPGTSGNLETHMQPELLKMEPTVPRGRT